MDGSPAAVGEKLPLHQKSESVFALTSGNRSREVMVTIGYGFCLDLESLSKKQTPRNSRVWEKFPMPVPVPMPARGLAPGPVGGLVGGLVGGPA